MVFFIIQITKEKSLKICHGNTTIFYVWEGYPKPVWVSKWLVMVPESLPVWILSAWGVRNDLSRWIRFRTLAILYKYTWSPWQIFILPQYNKKNHCYILLWMLIVKYCAHINYAVKSPIADKSRRFILPLHGPIQSAWCVPLDLPFQLHSRYRARILGIYFVDRLVLVVPRRWRNFESEGAVLRESEFFEN